MEKNINSEIDDKLLFLSIKYKEAKENNDIDLCEYYQNLFLHEINKEGILQNNIDLDNYYQETSIPEEKNDRKI